MKTKYIIILILILVTSFTIAGCSEIEGLPAVMELEASIKEIIESKGDNYDFLSDEQYMNKMYELAGIFVDNNLIKEDHYTLGNLNHDNIPELVVFRERDPNDVNDQGALEIYGFLAGKYSLISRVSMNYDNTNYQLAIGKIGPNQKGILVNNQVGSQSGVTYGFILEDGKLVSILNENKVNLISINTDNAIKDIDGDGILEFSINTINPESKKESSNSPDTILYWYKWDGSDGANLVKYEILGDKENLAIDSDREILRKAESLFELDRLSFLDYMKDNMDSLTRHDNTRLLEKYINILLKEANPKGMVINNLFSRYQLGNSSDYLFNKYGLSLERLNDTAYLSRDKVLDTERELKENLIYNLKLGYKLREKDGKYNYTVNYQTFLEVFGENILSEYRDYYRILALDSNNQYFKNDTLLITLDKLAERIILIDNFTMTYPYSKFIDELNPIYNEYLSKLLYGSKNSTVFDIESNLIDEEVLVKYEDIVEKYPNTNLGLILTDYIDELGANELKISKDIIIEINSRHLR